MAEEAKFLIKAEDQASAVFQQVGDNADRMGKTVQGAGNEIQANGQKVSKSLLDNKEGLLAVGATAGVAFAGLSGLVKDSTDKFATFEKQMSEAKAVLGLFGDDENTKKQFKDLSDLAIKLGADTKFTAKEAADGITVLGQAGFSTGEIMKTMGSVMNLAAATNISIADSADIASSVLRQYGMDVDNVGQVMDVLNKTSVMSNADILNLRDSFNYFGSTAKVLGISLEESSAAIGILANNGIKGSAATRALGTALTKLANPSNKMQDAMDQLGWSAFDSSGKFIGLAGIVDTLGPKLDGLTQQQRAAAVSAIFGADAYGEMSILLGAGGEKIKEFTKELQNAGGTTDNMAKVQLDNLKGSIELLSGAFDSLQIRLGSSFAPIVRSVVDAIRPIIDAIGDFAEKNPRLSATLLLVVTGLTGLVTVLAALGLALPMITAGRTMLTAAMVPVILPILAIIAGLGLLYAARNTNFLGIRDIAMSIFEEIKSVVTSAWQFITDTWNGFLDAIGISNSDFRNGVATIISVTWEAIKLGLSLAFTIITGLFKATWSFLKEYIGGTLTGIRDIILGAINFIVGFFQKDGKDKMEKGRSMMVDGFIGLTKAPINGVLALFEGMVNTAISYVNKLIDAANSLPGAKMLGLTRISPISLPRLARGGFAEGPTLGDHLANMGSSAGIVSGSKGIDKVPTMLSDGELVLNQAQQGSLASFIRGNSGNSAGIEVTVTGNNFYGDDKSFAEKIGDTIVAQFRQHYQFETF